MGGSEQGRVGEGGRVQDEGWREGREEGGREEGRREGGREEGMEGGREQGGGGEGEREGESKVREVGSDDARQGESVSGGREG